MGHNLVGSRIKVRVRDSCSVVYVEASISGGISHCIRLVGLRYMVHRKIRKLRMLEISVLKSIQHSIISRQITEHLLFRWMVSFVIKLFLF